MTSETQNKKKNESFTIKRKSEWGNVWNFSLLNMDSLIFRSHSSCMRYSVNLIRASRKRGGNCDACLGSKEAKEQRKVF